MKNSLAQIERVLANDERLYGKGNPLWVNAPNGRQADDQFKSDGAQPSRLNRQDAARFLTRIGLPIAPATLAKKAVDGSGPPYSLWNCRASYCVDHLLQWAEAQLGPTLANTAQRKAVQRTRSEGK